MSRLWDGAGALVGGSDELPELEERVDPKKPETAPKAPELVSVCAADIEPEPISWVWYGRLARGKQTSIAGEPGAGKSQVLIAMTAVITTGGNWPCREGKAPLGSVVILSAEDSPSDTLIPRLIAAGADRSRVHIVKATRTDDGERHFNLKTDLAALESKIRELGDVVLVGIDPVSSYMGETDAHRNTSVRAVLDPLSDMADRTGVAVVTITHFRKEAGGRPRRRHCTASWTRSRSWQDHARASQSLRKQKSRDDGCSSPSSIA